MLKNSTLPSIINHTHMKTILLILFFFINFSAIARVNHPIFQTRKPTILVPPQSSHLALFLNLEPRLIFMKKKSTQRNKPTWIDLNLISSYEISPFTLESLNIGIQGTIGSSGFVLHTIGKWIPFPDYNFQPAIGFFGDIYAGISPQTKSIAGSNIQLLVKKSFKAPSIYAAYMEDWGAYLAPFAHFDFIKQKLDLNLILGLNFNFDETQLVSSKWSLNLEGRYNKSFYEIGLQFLLYIR